MDIAIHINPSQPHQVEHGQWLQSGFKRHGLIATVTPDIEQEAGIHVVSGPHYAKEYWLGHPRTILLDRAYYHEEQTGKWHSMDWVSAGWMNSDGGRSFTIGCGQEPPEPKTGGSGTGTIFLADYDGPVEQADTVRLHPAREAPGESLHQALRRHAVAIGYQTSALVTAALEGLEVVCKDSRNIMAQPNWLELLPYADWHYSQIASGELWEHLQSSLSQP